MRYHSSIVRLVFFSSEKFSSRNAYSYIKDTCGEAKCTESLVLEVVAAVDVATKACVGAEAALSVELAKAIADVIVVSLIPSPGSDATNSLPVPL